MADPLTGYAPHVQQFWDGNDLIGFLIHLRLPEYQTLLRGKGGNHVDRVIGTLLLG
jgi:hypothetical protein